MSGCAGSPASFCDLIVSSFPDDTDRINNTDFELAFASNKKRQYYLKDGCQLNVLIKSKWTDKLYRPPIINGRQDLNKVLYFELRGPITLAALLQIDCYLELCSSTTYFSAERDLFLEQNSTCQSVVLLQDMSRITLLRCLWSRMTYEDAETLQGILYSCLALEIKSLWEWLNAVDERRRACKYHSITF